jgi:hypothetical protein
MALFKVYEVIQETVLRRWLHEVEADTAEEAMELVQLGGGEEVDCGIRGDQEFGESGWAIADNDDEGWDKAVEVLGTGAGWIKEAGDVQPSDPA